MHLHIAVCTAARMQYLAVCGHAGDGGLVSVLELVHLFLNAPVWSEAAMERAKAIWVSHHRSLTKSLERSSADRVMDAMMGPER